MFKSKSYNVEKASKKNKEEVKSSSSSSSSPSSSPSSSKGTMTLKKKTKSKVQITKNHQNIDKKSILKKLSQHGKKMRRLLLKMKWVKK